MSNLEQLAKHAGFTSVPTAMPTKDAAQLLGMSKSLLRRLAKEGAIPSVRVSERKQLFLASDLEAYLSRPR